MSNEMCLNVYEGCGRKWLSEVKIFNTLVKAGCRYNELLLGHPGLYTSDLVYLPPGSFWFHVWLTLHP
jgi:hypothetical protein